LLFDLLAGDVLSLLSSRLFNHCLSGALAGKEPNMTDIKTVLCPLDFSTLSERELQLGAQVCERFGARMVVQHNIDFVPPIYLANAWMYSETHMYPEEERELEASRRIQEVLDRQPASVRAEGRVTFGNLEECILNLAYQLPADLILMGTHGPTSAQHVSHTDRVLTQSPCPVLTMRDGSSGDLRFPNLAAIDTAELEPALLPMDFSPHSLRALEYALSLMDHVPIKLHLLHVEANLAIEDLRAVAHRLRFEEEKQRRLDASLQQLKSALPARYSNQVACEVRMGPVVEQVIAYAQQIQCKLILMGAHTRNVLDRVIFGANSQGVLHQSPCPVWLIPEARPEPHSWVVAAGAHRVIESRR
jgi:nucleotide-binding universal stress UspA family protein